VVDGNYEYDDGDDDVDVDNSFRREVSVQSLGS
jgi:hypothetical protein